MSQSGRHKTFTTGNAKYFLDALVADPVWTLVPADHLLAGGGESSPASHPTHAANVSQAEAFAPLSSSGASRQARENLNGDGAISHTCGAADGLVHRVDNGHGVAEQLHRKPARVAAGPLYGRCAHKELGRAEANSTSSLHLWREVFSLSVASRLSKPEGKRANSPAFWLSNAILLLDSPVV